MNTIQRVWHPKTFEEANRKLIEDFGKDWDEMYPLDKYYQDMHLNLFPKKIVHAENLGRRHRHGAQRPVLYRLLPAKGHGMRLHVGSLRRLQRGGLAVGNQGSDLE